MEYEPEWESAFNLHVKLAHSITLSTEWASSEKSIAAAAFWMALRRFADTYPPSPRVLKGNYTGYLCIVDSSQHYTLYRMRASAEESIVAVPFWTSN